MKGLWLWSIFLCAISMVGGGTSRYNVHEDPSYRVILDTDVGADDLFALLYLLKSNRSEFNLQAVTVNTNSWTNAGHAVNQIYDILYMMGRDDIDVGVGGDGGILENGTILPNVGGYLPIIDQGCGTAGPCRYRQAIPVGSGGRLDIDTNMGIRRRFLPQGNRRYSPLRQPTAQQVIHSGIPVTLVPLDATNTIPITQEYFKAFGKNQRTYEAQYLFKSLKITRDTWFDDQFYTTYFMWDSFMAGVAASCMCNTRHEENEFAEMEYMNITVITSNEPYGVSDGSNTFFGDRKIPKFNLQKNGVHSGHVQTGIQDPFCLRENATGICKDGYTEEVTGRDSVRVRVATRAKPNRDETSTLDRAYYVNFLVVC